MMTCNRDDTAEADSVVLIEHAVNRLRVGYVATYLCAQIGWARGTASYSCPAWAPRLSASAGIVLARDNMRVLAPGHEWDHFLVALRDALAVRTPAEAQELLDATDALFTLANLRGLASSPLIPGAVSAWERALVRVIASMAELLKTNA